MTPHLQDGALKKKRRLNGKHPDTEELPETPSRRLRGKQLSSPGHEAPVEDADGQQLVRARRNEDGSVSPENLEHALQEAQLSLGDARRHAKWQSMARMMGARSCPPLIKEKWESCGNDKRLKNKVFELFLATGGDVGQMNAVETIVRT